jgi:hypothetical protein
MDSKIQNLFEQFLATKNFDIKTPISELSEFEKNRLLKLTKEFFDTIEQFLVRVDFSH